MTTFTSSRACSLQANNDLADYLHPGERFWIKREGRGPLTTYFLVIRNMTPFDKVCVRAAAVKWLKGKRIFADKREHRILCGF